MSNRFLPAWLLVLAALSTSALAKAPETVNIGYQKANIFALLKYRGTLDESLKKQGIAVRWVEFPAGPQMLEGLNVGSIDLAATGDAPPAFAQAAQADLVYLAHSPANPKTEAIVVPEQSAIHSVADLKGKRVGLNKGSDVNYLLVAALEKAGLSYKDITPVYLPPADARAAFQRGAIDAWVIWGYAVADEAEGSWHLLDEVDLDVATGLLDQDVRGVDTCWASADDGYLQWGLRHVSSGPFLKSINS